MDSFVSIFFYFILNVILGVQYKIISNSFDCRDCKHEFDKDFLKIIEYKSAVLSIQEKKSFIDLFLDQF